MAQDPEDRIDDETERRDEDIMGKAPIGDEDEDEFEDVDELDDEGEDEQEGQ